jgi:hypothetical protein
VNIWKPSSHQRYILKLYIYNNIGIRDLISVSSYGRPLSQRVANRDFRPLLTLKHILYVEVLFRIGVV